MVLEVGPTDRGAEFGPQLVTARCEREAFVAGLEDSVRGDCGEARSERLGIDARTEEVHVIRGHRGDNAVLHGDIDVLALSRGVSRVQRHQNAYHGEHSRGDVGNRVAAAGLLSAFSPGDADEGAGTLDDEIHGGVVPRGAVLSVPGPT